MERPCALWAALLALVPWLLLFLPPQQRTTGKIPFPAMRLLAAPNQRSRRRRRRVLRAALRSAAVAALAILWAAPNPDALRRPDAEANVDPVSAIPADRHAESPRSVLILDGTDPDGERSHAFRPADYVALALGAQFDDLRVDMIAPLDFAARPDAALRSCDALVIMNLDALAPGEEAAVARFLAHGGSALVWAGSRTLPDRWSATFRRWNLDVTVDDAPLDSRAGAPDAPSVSDDERLFLTSFPGGASARVDALPARRAFPCAGPGAALLLRDRESGRPVFTKLSEKLCWFAVPLDDEDGALAALPAFPALVEQLLLWSAGVRPTTAPTTDDPPRLLTTLLFAALWCVLLLALVAELTDPILRASAPDSAPPSVSASARC